MAAASVEEVGHAVLAPVLHVCRELDRESVCAARCGDRGGALLGEEQSHVGAAASAICVGSPGDQVSANVSGNEVLIEGFGN